MTKRSQWVAVCLLWTAIWFILGVIIWPFWLLSLISLSMILLPVGVSDTPSPKNRPNPTEWSKRERDKG